MPPEIHFEEIDLESQSGFHDLHRIQQVGARVALAVLHQAKKVGLLDFTQIRRILDFGAGIGGPTFALSVVGRLYGAKVDAVEKAVVIANCMPPAIIDNHLIPGDGLSHLNSLDRRGLPKYDLVTAFMLGPDGMGELFKNLAQACGRGLTPNGRLLVTSDQISLFNAVALCEGLGVEYHLLNEHTPTLILSQPSCGNIQEGLFKRII